VNLHLALGGSFEEDAEKRVVEGATEEQTISVIPTEGPKRPERRDL